MASMTSWLAQQMFSVCSLADPESRLSFLLHENQTPGKHHYVVGHKKTCHFTFVHIFANY